MATSNDTDASSPGPEGATTDAPTSSPSLAPPPAPEPLGKGPRKNTRRISGLIVSLDEEEPIVDPTSEGEAVTASISFNVATDVGLELETPWQLDADGSPNPATPTFSITGPPEVVAFINRHANGRDAGGYLSPLHTVTIASRSERKAAGVPLECTTFCFCYPLECLSGLYEQLVGTEGRCDPWLFFLLLGGYAYVAALVPAFVPAPLCPG